MDLFPAVDLRDGRAVRLVQGDFEREQSYGDPVELARRFADAGARWIHVVDLDGARTGQAINRSTVLEIASQVDASIQTGGGIRSEKDVEQLIDGGVDRVILGTAAVRDPALVERLACRYPGRVGVAIDHRGPSGQVAVAGWQTTAPVTVGELLSGLEAVPLAAVVVTSIERDGMLEGPDLDGLGEALGGTAHPVIASGGVRSADDLRRLRSISTEGRFLAGAIVGKALVAGSLDIAEALKACTPYG